MKQVVKRHTVCDTWPGKGPARVISGWLIYVFLCVSLSVLAADQTNAVPTQPLSLSDALNIALEHNPSIQKARKDLEANEGVVLQTRAIALPRLQIGGDYAARQPSAVEQPPLPIPGFTFGNDQSWQSGVRLVQSIYEGGRMVASVRAAKLMRQAAMLNYQTSLANAVLDVELAYYAVLLAAEQITVQEASVKLLEQELLDTRRRLEAGTVPRYNVLRAEVELANARPKLIRARNLFRISKNNLANQLGLDVPQHAPEDIPLVLSDKLTPEPLEIDLPTALNEALVRRPELGALRKSGAVLKENLVSARAGYKPSLQAFGGYEAKNSIFSTDLDRVLHGWMAGVQLSWDLFDGGSTRGRVIEANANLGRNAVEQENTRRQIELEVRTAVSVFIEAKEVLESQKKVLEAADETLRLATARSDAGTGTQLDVLGAQTALTDARTTQALALHEYAAARARLRRAVGANLPTNAQ